MALSGNAFVEDLAHRCQPAIRNASPAYTREREEGDDKPCRETNSPNVAYSSLLLEMDTGRDPGPGKRVEGNK